MTVRFSNGHQLVKTVAAFISANLVEASDMNRRLFIGALAAGGVGTGAGCLGSLGDDVTTFSAAPARVSEEAAAEVGYEYQGTRKRIDGERVGGEDIEATSYVSMYDRSIELPAERFGDDPIRAGVFGVLTSPQVTVAGEDFNPISELSNRELAERIQEHYDGLEIDRAVGGRAVESLGERFSIQSYEGSATLQHEYVVGVSVDIIDAEHEGQHIVVGAIYPADRLLTGVPEQARIDTLIRELEHYDGLEVDIVETNRVADGDG